MLIWPLSSKVLCTVMSIWGAVAVSATAVFPVSGRSLQASCCWEMKEGRPKGQPVVLSSFGRSASSTRSRPWESTQYLVPVA